MCCLWSPFYQCGCPPFCSHLGVFHFRQMRPHVDSPSAFHSRTFSALPSTRALVLSFTRSVSATLPLYALILALPVKLLSFIARIRHRQKFVVRFCRSSVRRQRNTTRTTSSVAMSPISTETTWNLLGSTSGILSTTILGNGGIAPSLSDATFFVNFNSRATITKTTSVLLHPMHWLMAGWSNFFLAQLLLW